ncbi:hypothetical protein [Streptomyces sp. NPDC008150]
MIRFLIGLVLGGVSSGATWLLTHDYGWTTVAGITALILDDLLDL